MSGTAKYSASAANTASTTVRSQHPAGAPVTPSAPMKLYGKRIMLRPLVPSDFVAWSEVRRRNGEWLLVWEPQRSEYIADPAKDPQAFDRRCVARDRERQAGTAYTLGLFIDDIFAGEVNLNNVVRGAMQTGTVGYWIDRKHAGNGYIAEGVAVLAHFAFEELKIHRIEVCIIPRNTNSKKVMEKLSFRLEGLSERFLEINGVWEDHLRYGFTIEEWHNRKSAMTQQWLAAKS
jgi:ribosomal-protein-alanine N-acetyltransferase